MYRQKVTDLVEITTLPVTLRKELASKVSVGLPELAAEYKSKDGTRRYLLKLQDNRTVEAVLMPENVPLAKEIRFASPAKWDAR